MTSLRAIQEAATPWALDWSEQTGGLRLDLSKPEDKAFLLTFDPLMVGKLLDVVEAAVADRDHAAECFGCETCESLQDEILATLAALEEQP